MHSLLSKHIQRGREDFKSAHTYQEALESAITLSEDEPNGVKAMFFFLYDQKYTHVHDNAFDDLLFHVEVYKTADKYGIPALMKVVAKELSKIVNTKWNDPLFPQAVLEGYGLPDYDGANGLCNGMQIACERNIDALRANKNFMTMLHHVPLLGARLTAFTIDQFQAYKKLSPNNNESPLFAMCPRCRSSISTRYYEHATKFNYSNTYSNYGKYFSCPAKCGFEFSEGLKTSDTAKVYM